MKEDLNFKGTQYNTLLSMFVAGYTIGQFPVRSRPLSRAVLNSTDSDSNSFLRAPC